MPRLITDWRRVLLLSLSFWMQVAGLLVLILPELRYRWTGQDYDPYFAWWLGVLFLVAGLGGRLYQQGLSPWREWLRVVAVAFIVIVLAVIFAWPTLAAEATEQQTLDIAVPFIAKEEGERLAAYRDAVGIPTIGFGHTEDVYMGMTITHAQALALLREDAARHRAGLHRYFTLTTRAGRLPPTRDAAYTSTAFNCGVTAIGKSTATRRLNAGDVAGGCEALTWWDKAGGRVLRGLFERRRRERALCMIGVR
ncbi:MAG: lysozyme [Mesorhizobium sp.]|nr:lysozyme [Mesorhizobium sp.]MBN9243926.1 lysozyme [Mesorhizobium sp.]